MTSDASDNLGAKFVSAVAALGVVDEPWIALSFLAGADLRATSMSTARHSKSDFQDAWTQAHEKLTVLEKSVRSAALISKNDHLEDVGTQSIKFLLVPYLFARLHSSFQGEQPERLAHLEKSKAALVEFFEGLDRLDLLDQNARDQVLDDNVEVARTPHQTREEKILRFKAEKAAEKKLTEIFERRVSHSYSIEDDEETLRECSLTIVQSAVRKGLDSVSSISQEIEILQFAARSRAKGIDPRAKSAASRKTAAASAIPGMPPTFQVVNNREEIRKGVFRPSHSLPTYTVEEWGEIEAANAAKKEQDKRNADIVKARQAAEEDSEGDEVADRETMEKRNWDNWRDENNKGSGNTTR